MGAANPRREPAAVLQLIDALKIGGAERVAVNIANALPADRYAAHVCATRADGALRAEVAPHIPVLILKRRGRFDPAAVARLVQYIRRHRIKLLHAHSTSLFIAVIASFFTGARVIWHDHYGRHDERERRALPYRLALTRTHAVIAVSEKLAAWARDRLGVPADRVTYLPNFSHPSEGEAAHRPDLPGNAAARIVCLANLRPQKDHLTLVRAMAAVVREVPDAHLLLVGSLSDTEQVARVRAEIAQLGLERQITLMGEQSAVAPILRACTIGVLSSKSEGLPLALIEYGSAELPAVATAVGQCSDVLDGGRAGLLVPAENPTALAEALIQFLRSSEIRKDFALRFRQRVADVYSAEAVIAKITALYDRVMSTKPSVQ